MKNKLLIYIFLFVFAFNTQAQQTVGLFLNTPEAFNGYTLFGPSNSTETYLIDNCGKKVHSWSSKFNPWFSYYLLEDGTLLRTGSDELTGIKSGIVEMIDWEGNVIWDYSINSEHGIQHHDIEPLPNGNILLIVWDDRSQIEVEEVGSTTNRDIIKSEKIIEIQPDLNTGGATIVWEWKAWDHLIQDADSTKPNYGIIAEHPERIDINFLEHNAPDWLHFNAVDYNEEFDQIILSAHSFSEFWIIDHSTSTVEAADTVGGIYGKGGDLLYRWGNPQAYDQGTSNDQKLFLQHNTHWIPKPLVDAGKILLFNNHAGTPAGLDYSTVNIVNTPVDANGFYSYTGGAYEPTDFDWTYQAPNPTDLFSAIQSGAQRLENGNTLICEGERGRFFEIDENENIVWEYVNPVNDMGPITQSFIPENNKVFRSIRFDANYKGFEGKSLVPQGYIEIGSTFTCNPFPSACDPLSVFANDTINAVCFEELDQIRKCYSNNIPDHQYGPFEGMETVEGQDFEYSMCLYPEIGTSVTELVEDPDMPDCGEGIIFGVSEQGVIYSPFDRLYWVNPNTKEENFDWHVEVDFAYDLDLNGGYVNDHGLYQYHNVPSDYFQNNLNIDSSAHSPIVGYAADGFPIYYKYLYSEGDSPDSGISAFESSYILKTGERPGDGVTAPNGSYDGHYLEDYEYIPSLSELDECGMRYGMTPDYPEGTHYYVLTDNWPYIPRCLKGEYVDNSFRLGVNCTDSTASDDCSSIISTNENGSELEMDVKLFPNPTNDYFKIELSENVSPNQISSVKIYSLNAAIVYESTVLEEVINAYNIPKGMYFIQVIFGRQQITKKLIIQ